MPEVVALFGMYEALRDHAVHHRHQGRVEAIDVEEGAGLVANAELTPGQHLEHFVERAEATWQGHKGVAEVEHAGFALVHVGNDFEPGDAAVRDLPANQLLGNHADYLAAGRQYRIDEDAHQADVAAAKDERQFFLRQARAERHRAFGIHRLQAMIGTAVDANRSH